MPFVSNVNFDSETFLAKPTARNVWIHTCMPPAPLEWESVMLNNIYVFFIAWKWMRRNTVGTQSTHYRHRHSHIPIHFAAFGTWHSFVEWIFTHWKSNVKGNLLFTQLHGTSETLFKHKWTIEHFSPPHSTCEVCLLLVAQHVGIKVLPYSIRNNILMSTMLKSNIYLIQLVCLL